MTATFHQLNPPMPVETPHGKALAHFLLDYGPEHVLWGCFIDATRACWWVPNPDVRAQGNPSMGRAPLTAEAVELFKSADEILRLDEKTVGEVDWPPPWGDIGPVGAKLRIRLWHDYMVDADADKGLVLSP